MEELPFELQVDTLLPLSANDIVAYCLSHPGALPICHSTAFWKRKLALEGYPPGQLDLIDAQNPAVQYKVLMSLLLSDDRINTAIANGQMRYLASIWDEESKNSIAPSSIYHRVSRRDTNFLPQLERLVDDPQIWKYLVGAALYDAASEEHVDATLILREVAGVSYSDLMTIIASTYHPAFPQLFTAVLARIDEEGAQDQLQTFAEHVILEGNGDEMLEVLLETRRQQLDLVRLLNLALEGCPVAKMLLPHLNISAN